MDDALKRLKALTREGTRRPLTVEEITELQALFQSTPDDDLPDTWTAVYGMWFSTEHITTGNRTALHRVLKPFLVEKLSVFARAKPQTPSRIVDYICDENKEAPDGDPT